MHEFDALNIATLPIADKVQRHMMASYYAIQLDKLQEEAKRLGYYFARAVLAAPVPPILAECLAHAVEYRRRAYLNPNQPPEEWERLTRYSMDDGYAQEHLRSMLAALSALGVRLQEGPGAFALLRTEERRRLQTESAPLCPTSKHAGSSSTEEAASCDLLDSLIAPATKETTS